MVGRILERKAARAPVASHRLFPYAVALWFAALIGIGSLILPVSLFEFVISGLGIPSLISAAQPPLGGTARLFISLSCALLGAAIGYFVAGRIIAETPQAGSGAAQPYTARSSHNSPHTSSRASSRLASLKTVMRGAKPWANKDDSREIMAQNREAQSNNIRNRVAADEEASQLMENSHNGASSYIARLKGRTGNSGSNAPVLGAASSGAANIGGAGTETTIDSPHGEADYESSPAASQQTSRSRNLQGRVARWREKISGGGNSGGDKQAAPKRWMKRPLVVQNNQSDANDMQGLGVKRPISAHDELGMEGFDAELNNRALNRLNTEPKEHNQSLDRNAPAGTAPQVVDPANGPTSFSGDNIADGPTNTGASGGVNDPANGGAKITGNPAENARQTPPVNSPETSPLVTATNLPFTAGNTDSNSHPQQESDMTRFPFLNREKAQEIAPSDAELASIAEANAPFGGAPTRPLSIAELESEASMETHIPAPKAPITAQAPINAPSMTAPSMTAPSMTAPEASPAPSAPASPEVPAAAAPAGFTPMPIAEQNAAPSMATPASPFTSPLMQTETDTQGHVAQDHVAQERAAQNLGARLGASLPGFEPTPPPPPTPAIPAQPSQTAQTAQTAPFADPVSEPIAMPIAEPMATMPAPILAQASAAMAEHSGNSGENSENSENSAPKMPFMQKPLGDLGIAELVERFALALKTQDQTSTASHNAAIPAALCPIDLDEEPEIHQDDANDGSLHDAYGALSLPMGNTQNHQNWQQWEEQQKGAIDMQNPFEERSDMAQSSAQTTVPSADAPVAQPAVRSAGQPAQYAVSPQQSDAMHRDQAETENALKIALEKLERMSGAA